MKKLTLLMLIIGLGLMGTMNAQSLSENSNTTSTKAEKILKVKPFSPLFNNLSFSYEQKIKNKISGEVSFGLIGAGFSLSPIEKVSGIHLSAGPRLYFGQDWKMKGMENIPLRGYFFKPEVLISTYKRTYSGFGRSATFNAVSGAVIFNLGRQFIAGDIVSIGISGGMGYGFGRGKSSNSDESWEDGNNYEPRFYSHILGPKELPVAAKADITIGFIIK